MIIFPENLGFITLSLLKKHINKLVEEEQLDKELDVDLLYPSTMTKFIIEFKNGQKFSIEIKERKR